MKTESEIRQMYQDVLDWFKNTHDKARSKGYISQCSRRKLLEEILDLPKTPR
jgi:hypothetical protein